jgi:lipopolysaccharide/colanic/teichoic acid biosynthesis glycosyltransferase
MLMETAPLDRRAARGGDLSAASNVHALPSPQPWQRTRFTARVIDEEAVSGHEFRRELEREKRRAERSRRALSLAVLRVPSADDARGLVDELLAIKRETDLVGWLDAATLAVLCVDTNAQGCEGFLRKVTQLTAGRGVVADAATFPEALFDSLTRGCAADDDAQAERLIAGEAESTGYAGKRIFDCLVAALLLLVVAPLLLLVALVIALDSPGPVIHRQKRLGRGGVPFTFYKFRSMWSDVDDRIHRDFVAGLIRDGDSQAAPPGSGADPYKLSGDARITRVGRFIRKTSIDELPQLFNVLRGDMSMVGPRPPLPYEVADYEPWHLRRILGIQPGITGLWQVEGRSRVGFNEMVRMDLRYLRQCSFGLDLRILVRTVRVVLMCDGAR